VLYLQLIQRINQPITEKMGQFHLCQVITSYLPSKLIMGALSTVPAGSNTISAKETTKQNSLPDHVTWRRNRTVPKMWLYTASMMGNVPNISQKTVTHLCQQPSGLALYLCSRTWELGYSFSHLSIHEQRLLVWEQLCLETSPPEMCHSATHNNISETH